MYKYSLDFIFQKLSATKALSNKKYLYVNRCFYLRYQLIFYESGKYLLNFQASVSKIFEAMSKEGT